MTQPKDVRYASQQYQEWLAALKNTAGLQTHNQRQAMMRAVMYELRECLTTDEVLRFAGALPPLPRGIFIENWLPRESPADPVSSASFVEKVFTSLSPHHIPPDTIVADVFGVRAQFSTDENARKMKSILPETLAKLWPDEK